MSATSSDYLEYIKEQLAQIPRIGSSRFFGGIGLTVGGVQFAMVMGNTVYFVVNQSTRDKYEQLGSGCFSYNTKARNVQVKKYFEVPAGILENQDELVAWAKESIHIAQSSNKTDSRLSPKK